MASSSSIKRAQAIKLCDLCNMDSIKWRCVECDRLICEKCRTIHLRVPVTSKHQIINLATPLPVKPQKIIIDNIPCRDHKAKIMCLYCKDCDFLVCPDCVSDKHHKHHLVSIESELDEKVSQLESMHLQVCDKIGYCNTKLKEIEMQTDRTDSIFDDSISKIKQRENELKEAVTENSKFLQDHVEGERSKFQKMASEMKSHTDQTMKKLENQRIEIEKALSSNQGQLLFDAPIDKADLNVSSLSSTIEQFIPDKSEAIQELFGNFQKMTLPPVQPEMELEVIKTFTTDLSSISRLQILDETSAFIAQGGLLNKQVVRKVNLKDDRIVTLNEISVHIEDMAMFSDNEILLSIWGSSAINILSFSGEMKLFLNVRSGYSKGISVTNGEVIVGVIDSSTSLSGPYKCKGELQIYNKNGDLTKTLKQAQLISPEKIRKNINQDIIVLDRTSSTTGRVVALNKMGYARWVYNDSPEINAVKKFNPLDIVTTSKGHIIVSDVDTNAFHELSQDGHLVAYKIVSTVGIQCPLTIKFDRKGQIWVGCGGGKLHIAKIK